MTSVRLIKAMMKEGQKWGRSVANNSQWTTQVHSRHDEIISQSSSVHDTHTFHGISHSGKGASIGFKSNMQGPHLSIMQLLLTLLYLTIFCDLIYVLGIKYFSPWFSRKIGDGTKYKILHGGGCKRMQNVGASSYSPKSEKNLTLDYLWRRIKAEARHLQRVNSQHRTITEAMMETRLKARSLDRERSISRGKFRRLSIADQKIDMVRWAARISADHDPRAK
ncbi:hypothetical protein PoB_005864500 [Plakobranchus ocellatus]|uniref:Uncharacterized protein n=1 Tax=Plakobranchus ocellatus TaxID=259542 RepID=A0AAV4CH03_9GAST|nr:hypothetical protein PoB_005864500 [Plakobranchus ocellatus]